MILTLARRALLAHKRRLIGLCSAIAIGVAFLTGTLVLADTMRASFSDVFAAANAGVDAVVQGTTDLSSPETGTQPTYVPDSLVPELQRLSGVTTVQPMAEGLAQVIGRDGNPIGGGGPPTIGGNWVPVDELNPQRVVAGRVPQAAGEVVIDAGTAQTGGIAVGDRINVLTPQQTRVRVVGITKYGDANSLGGVTYVGFTFDQAVQLLVPEHRLSSIVLRADGGTSPDDLVAEITPLLPRGIEALTGEQLTQRQNENVQADFLSFFQIFLTVFAIIALVVSTFSIYNTFTVITAQKTQESALLRAVGASRGQVLGSIAGESLLIGVLAAAIGVVAGIGVAAGLSALFELLGAGLPNTGLAISPGSLLAGFVVGLIVTLIAALLPAVRASRIAPIAALREVAVETESNLTRRTIFGGVPLVLGVALLASLLFASGNELARVALGAVLTFTGFLVFGPVAARPVAGVIGDPISRARGVSGRMARANARRNPKRTASTAAALMVGVAVVSMFTIFASSMKTAITDSFVGDLTAQLTLTNDNFAGAGFDPGMITDLRALPQVAAVSTLDPAQVFLDGDPTDVTVVDVPGIESVTDVSAELTPDAVAVDAATAAEQRLVAGDTVTVGFADGTTAKIRIGSVYQKNNLVSGFLMPRSVYSAHVDRAGIFNVFIALEPGVPEADGQAAAQQVATAFAAGDVQTRDQFADEAAGQIDQLLAIIYALLVLAIIIALMGIANTLSLSVFERTRELGLLRAVGQTRPQLRAMVRWESVIIALFGTLGGIGLGVILGWALFAAVATSAGFAAGLSVSVSSLLLVAVIGAGVGVLAGLRPAHRAARLNVLAAIASE
jgi:putative ABC transport system permease protein